MTAILSDVGRDAGNALRKDMAGKAHQHNFDDGLDNRVENLALEMPRTH
jgi:hypothetical protein